MPLIGVLLSSVWCLLWGCSLLISIGVNQVANGFKELFCAGTREPCGYGNHEGQLGDSEEVCAGARARGGGTISCEMMKTKWILMKCRQGRVGGPAVFCFCAAFWKGLKSLKPDTGHQSGWQTSPEAAELVPLHPSGPNICRLQRGRPAGPSSISMVQAEWMTYLSALFIYNPYDFPLWGCCVYPVNMQGNYILLMMKFSLRAKKCVCNHIDDH